MEPDERELTRRWVEQWKETGAFLEAMRRADLRAMSPQAAFDASEAILGSEPCAITAPAERLTSSGLIEQQRLFGRLRPAK